MREAFVRAVNFIYGILYFSHYFRFGVDSAKSEMGILN